MQFFSKDDDYAIRILIEFFKNFFDRKSDTFFGYRQCAKDTSGPRREQWYFRTDIESSTEFLAILICSMDQIDSGLR